jgi:hypothetical protein
VRKVVVSKRRTKAGGRIAVSATARAKHPTKGVHDRRVGHKASNEHVVNAVKRW